MDIITKTISFLTQYKSSVRSVSQVLLQKEDLISGQVFSYEKVAAEEYVVQQLLQFLDLKASEQYRSLLRKLSVQPLESKKPLGCQSGHLSRATSVWNSGLVSTVAVAAPQTPEARMVLANPFYNPEKQEWGHSILEKLLNLINKVKEAAPDDQTISALAQEITLLVNKGYALSDADFQTLYGLPQRIFMAIEDSEGLTGAQKTEFVNEFSEVYETGADIRQKLTKARIGALLNVISLIEQTISEEELEPFTALKSSLLALQAKASLSEEELEQVSAIGTEIGGMINESSLQKDDKIFLERVLTAIYQEEVAALNSYQEAAAAVVFVNTRQQEVFSEVAEMVSVLMKTFSAVRASDAIPPGDLAGCLQLVRTIESRFHELTEQQKQALNTAVTTLETIPIAGVAQGSSLENHFVRFFGVLQGYFVAGRVSSVQPAASGADIIAVIQQEATALRQSDFVGAKYLSDGMDTIRLQGNEGQGTLLYTNGKPQSSSIVLFSTNANNRTVLDVKVFDTISQALTWALESPTTTGGMVADKVAAALSRFQVEKLAIDAVLTSNVTKAQTEAQAVSKIQDEVQAALLMAYVHENEALALPSSVASVLINHYMPREVEYLEQVYGDVYYSNLGASVGATIIQAISTFVNAATVFNFGSFVGQSSSGKYTTQGNAYTGSYERAKAHLAKEVQRTAEFLQKTYEAIAVVEKQIEIVKADPKITTEQRVSLVTMLNGYKDNLDSISSSLIVLQMSLSPLKVEAGSTYDMFNVTGGATGWQKQLDLVESTLVSGASGNPVVLGMFSLQAKVQSDQQAFADMGQNFQLEAHMRLTAMQQEWTTVSTSLQILNQIYMLLIRHFAG